MLNFKTKVDDIERFLRRNGIEGPISIRLLTDDQGESRGMAFIELEGPREMNKCLQLHHQQLNGRCINIEKSAGGGREKKRQKIQEIRQERDGF